MIPRKTVFLASFLLSIIVCFDGGYSQKIKKWFCPNTVQYNLDSTNGRAYRDNVGSLLSELSSKASDPNGFYNFTAVTSNSATAYGLFYCWGEATAADCQTCVKTTTSDILGTCPNTTWAVLFGQNCMLRFSNESIFSRRDTNPDATLVTYTTEVVGNITLFNEVLSAAFDEIVDEAAKGDGSGKKYAVRESNYTLFENTLYSLGQCTPDISSLDCRSCLTQAVQTLPGCCNGSVGGNVLFPSCRIRYETYPFFDSPPPSPRPATNQASRGISTSTIAAIVIPILVVIVVLVAIFFCKAMRAKNRKTAYFIGETSSVSNIISTDREFIRYSFSQIQAFTNNFADENIIGRGGFGPVYKGSLPNEIIVAVKRLSRSSTQGGEEFINEITLVAKLQHRNLVRLIGYCLEKAEMILIYEFVTNKSLDYFLFDPEKQKLLDWRMRYKIIGGIAKGLLYLHEDSRVNIIHRDLKPGNVLLDQHMNAKIADFGLAKLFEIDQFIGRTTKIAGTLGYMAPEYAMRGIFSVKSDVFSFGVLVLEIICGKKISNIECFGGENLLTYAWNKWREEKPLELMDPAIGKLYDRNKVVRCIHIGLLCVENDVERRPTMASVISMFNSDSISLSTPNSPAFSIRSSIPRELPQFGYSDKSSHLECSGNELSITQCYPR